MSGHLHGPTCPEACFTPATVVVVHEYEGNVFEARMPADEAALRVVTLAEEGIEATIEQ